MPPLETEEEAAENIANIYESRDDTINKEESDFNEYGIDINGLDRDGYNINGVNRNGVDKDGLNINGIEGTTQKYPKRKVHWRDGDGALSDQYGFNSTGFNKDGYDIYGFDIDGFNKDGCNIDGFNKNGLNKDGINKYGYKKNQAEV